jgi:hypothetical protein
MLPIDHLPAHRAFVRRALTVAGRSREMVHAIVAVKRHAKRAQLYVVRPVSKRNQMRRSVSSIQFSNRLVVATSFDSPHRS